MQILLQRGIPRLLSQISLPRAVSSAASIADGALSRDREAIQGVTGLSGSSSGNTVGPSQWSFLPSTDRAMAAIMMRRAAWLPSLSASSSSTMGSRSAVAMPPGWQPLGHHRLFHTSQMLFAQRHLNEEPEPFEAEYDEDEFEDGEYEELDPSEDEWKDLGIDVLAEGEDEDEDEDEWHQGEAYEAATKLP